MIIGRLLREARDASWSDFLGQDPSRIPGPGEGMSVWAGVPVNEMTALQFGAVFSCVRLLTDTLASFPIGAFQKVGGVAQPVEPGPRILEEPHPEMEFLEWISRLAWSYEMRGNAYGVVEGRTDSGQPRLIRPMHPDEVTPKREGGRLVYRVRGYNRPLEPLQAGGLAGEVMHVKGMTPPGINNLEGLSPIGLARQTIGTALAATEYGARYFADSANPSGYLSTDQDLEDDDAKALKDAWRKAQGSRHRDVAVLSGGLKFASVTIAPEEAQFLQTIGAKKVDIAGWWGVPPHLIGEVTKSTSWGTGIEEQNLGFVVHTMAIRVLKFESAIGRLLLPQPQYAKFNVAGLLRMRLTEQFRAFLMARQGGWLNIDEIRDKLELPPLPDGKGQDYISPLNYGPIPPGGLVIDPTKDDPTSDRSA